jgi:hypothetical protein
MKLEFRTLKESEIDVRVAQVKQNGLSLLLYKDARVDMNILDETVGSFNWQKKYETIDGRLYCTVSVYDQEKGIWVSKQDVGTESNTEKEKGQASDSFKRACFNWGIGRELYTAPFIWCSKDCNIYSKGKQGNKEVFGCNDRFIVEKILFDDKKIINALSIKNTTSGKRVFVMMPPK